MEWGDAIGTLFNTYTTVEKQKVDQRLATSREQVAAYEAQAAASAAAESSAVPKWAIFAGLAVAAVLVWSVVK